MNQVKTFCRCMDLHLQKNGLKHKKIKFDLRNMI